MRATVVVPPVRDFYFTRHRFSALGAHTVVRILETHGICTTLLNFPLSGHKPAHIPLPPALDYLKPYLVPAETGKLSYFTGLKHFGPPLDECAQLIVKENPGILFFSCFAFCYSQAALELAARVKQYLPAIPVAIGGAGVTAYPEYFIRSPHIDYAFTGEAEAALPRFIALLQTGAGDFAAVPNLYRKQGGQIIKPAVYKKTEAADLGFTWSKTLETGQRIYLATSLSRGCRKHCRFCTNYADHRFRMLTPGALDLERLAAELAFTSKTVSLNFEDDNFLTAPARFFKILDAIKLRFPAMDFYAENGIDYTCLDDHLTLRLIRAGFKQFNLSLGSIHPRLLEQEQRRVDLQRYLSVLAVLAKLQIPSVSYFICGFEHETAEHIAATLTFLAGLPTLIGISLYYAVPGLPAFRDYSLFDSLSPLCCLGSAAYPWNGTLSTGVLVTAFRLSRLLNLQKAGSKTADEAALLDLVRKEKRLFTTVKTGKQSRVVEVPGMEQALVHAVLSRVQVGKGGGN